MADDLGSWLVLLRDSREDCWEPLHEYGSSRRDDNVRCVMRRYPSIVMGLIAAQGFLNEIATEARRIGRPDLIPGLVEAQLLPVGRDHQHECRYMVSSTDSGRWRWKGPQGPIILPIISTM